MLILHVFGQLPITVVAYWREFHALQGTAFKRDPNCPGPAGLPANLRCQRCARGLCEAPGEKFSQNCGGPDGKPPQIVCPICMRKRQFSTHDQVTQLVATNHMSHGVAHSFKAVMSVMAKYRFRLHLDREGEKDFVFTNQGKRDGELAILNAKSPASRTEAEKERHTRLTAGTLMTRAEVKDLTDVIPNLAFIMALARTFVKEKEKALGKRGNPFV